MLSHRIIYAHVYGDIPEALVIDHIDGNKANNNIDNLQLMTQQENCKKSALKRDYKFASNNTKNKHTVLATDLTTKKVY
jgi:hypothetical protein